MPAAQHPVFKQPTDPGIPVWRYMDFTKFVSMLESRSLFFARSDKLGDPFEGSYSRGNQTLRPIVYEEVHKDMNPEMIARISENFAAMTKWQLKWTFVNCWHMNSGESASMWKLYAKTNEAIAVRSSYSKLAGVLDEHTYLGTVEYIDFEQDWMPEGNTLPLRSQAQVLCPRERSTRFIYQTAHDERRLRHDGDTTRFGNREVSGPS